MLAWLNSFATVTGINKIVPYLLIAGAALFLILVIISKLVASGENKEKLRNVEAQIETYTKEQAEYAKAASLDTATARRRLRERWTK